ncbi:hypothetical protein Q4Y15_001533 [Campylobacter fetus]|uniref:Uncharacterized protein n=2 Tax=Campylobacter fetus TaxID=196 RepID=A0RRC0_CAMFF|nr:hypothetical protein [Campylobacter fetus]ABK82546.1 conserved hypothetical protein [Campylobacter fetus subsp. fetus 82-40]EAH8300674.1 hypothetical protein [Campylobacter fetus]EAI3916480.1 hypothetical protein [Campylobacter fetus]EAI3919841.1 hypothetical protein [Campylobacter fetus]EAI5647783.1 hypothetical protein [Campylobacter fetus]
MIYIYPYGGFGKSVAEILTIFDIKHNFIDDNVKHHKLSDFKLDTNDEILISISDGYTNLKSKVDNLNIKNQNGVLYCANLISQFKNTSANEIMKKNCKVINAIDAFYNKFSLHYKEIWNKIISDTKRELGKRLNGFYKQHMPKNIWGGVYLISFAQNKHLYKIPYLLENKLINKNIVYIYPYKEKFEGRNIEIAVPYRLFEFIDFLPNVLTLFAGIKANKNSIYFCVEHIYAAPFVFGMYSDEAFYKKYYKEQNLNYIFSSCKKNFMVENALKADYEVIQAGYPSLDKNLDEYSDNEILKEWILVAPRIDDFLTPARNDLISKLLDLGYKVIYRPHPNEEYDSLPKPNNKNFILDINENIIKSFNISFTIITNHSSLAHTYPLTTLRKAILFMPEENFTKGINNKTFFDENLHLKATNFDEIILYLENMKNDKNYLQEKEKIKDYRQNEVYNLGNSSEFIAEFILNHSKEIN